MFKLLPAPFSSSNNFVPSEKSLGLADKNLVLFLLVLRKHSLRDDETPGAETMLACDLGNLFESFVHSAFKT